MRTSANDVSQSAFYGKPKPDEERFKVLDKCYNDGELFWDSADMYQDSEDLLGMHQPPQVFAHFR